MSSGRHNMAFIDKVRVNGTDYGISTGGDFPLSVYIGAGSSGFPSFVNYESVEGEEYLELNPTFFLRRTGGSDNYTYDLIMTTHGGTSAEEALADINYGDWR